MDSTSIILIGNIHKKYTHGGYDGDVFHPDGVCRCLNAAVGGASQTYVLIEETPRPRDPGINTSELTKT